MRKKILSYLEKNSRIDTRELAIILGEEESAVTEEIKKMDRSLYSG